MCLARLEKLGVIGTVTFLSDGWILIVLSWLGIGRGWCTSCLRRFLTSSCSWRARLSCSWNEIQIKEKSLTFFHFNFTCFRATSNWASFSLKRWSNCWRSSDLNCVWAVKFICRTGALSHCFGRNGLLDKTTGSLATNSACFFSSSMTFCLSRSSLARISLSCS